MAISGMKVTKAKATTRAITKGHISRENSRAEIFPIPLTRFFAAAGTTAAD